MDTVNTVNGSDRQRRVFASVDTHIDHTDGKRQLILQSLEKNQVETLRELARSAGGLVDDELRRKAWPVLLGLNRDSTSQGTVSHESAGDHPTVTNESTSDHEDPPLDPEKCNQVQLDVDRSFVYYPTAGDEARFDRAELRRLLSRHIRAVLARTELEYYQGYHDVAQVVVMIFGDQSTPVLEAISLHYLRDFMTPDLEPSLQQLQFIPAVVSQARPALAAAMESIAPFYGLSAVLTLFAHHVRSYNDMCQIMDYVFACESMAVPLYMYAALVLLVDDVAHRGGFSTESDDSNDHESKAQDRETAIEMTSFSDGDWSSDASKMLETHTSLSAFSTDNLHCVLTEMSDWVGNKIPLQDVLSLAESLSIRYPLQAFTHLWNGTSEFSVLKQGVQVSRTQNAIYAAHRQSEEAERHQRMPAIERDQDVLTNVKWMQLTSKYSTPITVSLAVGAVGILAAMYSRK